MTGHRCFLPSPEVYASSAAILIGDNAAAGPFQLLALDQVYEGHTRDNYVSRRAERGTKNVLHATDAFGKKTRNPSKRVTCNENLKSSLHEDLADSSPGPGEDYDARLLKMDRGK
jgi:hypothetical protein